MSTLDYPSGVGPNTVVRLAARMYAHSGDAVISGCNVAFHPINQPDASPMLGCVHEIWVTDDDQSAYVALHAYDWLQDDDEAYKMPAVRKQPNYILATVRVLFYTCDMPRMTGGAGHSWSH
jgi:hypothetical protein